jgi:hypothetical protein
MEDAIGVRLMGLMGANGMMGAVAESGLMGAVSESGMVNGNGNGAAPPFLLAAFIYR